MKNEITHCPQHGSGGLGGWMLRLCLPGGDAEAMAGDLTEEYGRRQHDSARRARARLWYLREVVVASAYGLRDRWRESSLPHLNGMQLMRNFLQDLKFGLRNLQKRPGFALGAIVTLALGIGANTAIFSVVNGILLRPLPFPEPDRLAAVWYDLHGIGFAKTDWPDPAIFRDWTEQAQTIDGIAAVGGFNPTLTGDGDPELLTGAAVTHNTFQVLGVEPQLGRFFTAEEDHPTGPAAVVISDSLWKRRFNADPEIVGKSIELGRAPAPVVGVLPEDFRFVHMNSDVREDAEIFVPIRLDPSTCGYGCYTIRVIARMAPGVTVEAVQEETTMILHRAAPDYDIAEKLATAVVSLHDEMVGSLRVAILLLLGSVGFVLLIACANVANLLLARAASRETEIAIRTAMGAGRRRLVGQFITESLLLAFLGGSLGIAVAYGGIRGLLAMLSSGISIPRLAEIEIDLTVLLFALGASLLTGVLFGLAPAFYALRPNVTASLKEGGRGTAGSLSNRRFRSALVVAEVALAMTLLIASALLGRGFLDLVNRDPGFRSDGVLAVSLGLPGNEYDREQRISFFERLNEQLLAIPGVDAVAGISTAPLSGNNGDASFRIEGRPDSEPGQGPIAWIRRVTPGYFRTMHIPLLRGRPFNSGDRSGEQRVIIINDAMQRRWWPDEDPVGAIMNFGSASFEIIGVVGDVKNFGLDADERTAAYLAHAQSPVGFMTLMVRTPGDPSQVAQPTRSEIQKLDPNLAVSAMAPMGDLVAGSVAPQRAIALLLGLFSLMAMLLAAIGLFGVMHYTVAQRSPEIGIRMALGAGRRGVQRMVVGQGMRLAFAGFGVGLVAALALTRTFSSLLYGISPTDPVAFVGVPLLLALVALVATWFPARKASSVDPLEALRYE